VEYATSQITNSRWTYTSRHSIAGHALTHVCIMHEAPSNKSRTEYAMFQSQTLCYTENKQRSEQDTHTAHIFLGVNLAGSSRGRAGGAGTRATSLLPSSITGASTADASRLGLPTAPVYTATAYDMYMRLCSCIRVLISFGWSCFAGVGLQQLQDGCAKHTCK